MLTLIQYGGRDYVISELDTVGSCDVRLIGLCEDALLIGFVFLRLDVNQPSDAVRKGFVEALRVDPDHRRRGHARALLRHIRDVVAVEERCEVLQYTTFTANKAAIALSTSMGYVLAHSWAYFTLDDPKKYPEPPFLCGLGGTASISQFGARFDDCHVMKFTPVTTAREVVELVRDPWLNQWWALSEVNEESAVEVLKTHDAVKTSSVLSIGTPCDATSPIGRATIFTLYPAGEHVSIEEMGAHIGYWTELAIENSCDALHFFYPSSRHEQLSNRYLSKDALRELLLLEQHIQGD